MPTVSTPYLSTLIDCSVALGAPADALFAVVPGGAPALTQPDARLPVELTVRVLDLAAQKTGLDSIGLRVGMQMRPAALRDAGYALAAASTVREALEISARYQALTHEIASTRLEIGPREARIVLQPSFPDPEAMRRVTEAIIASYVSIGRWLLWDQERPLASAHFRHAEPCAETAALCRSLFGLDVTFGAPVDMLVIDSALVSKPLPNSNPALVQLLTGRLDARLAAFKAACSLRNRVIARLNDQIRIGKPNLDETARLMGMSGRTLRRRLAEEGLSYSDLLSAVRKDAAEAYIHEERLTLAEIAGLLGYSDQTAFVRVFKGWFGISPGAYRMKLRGRTD